MCCVSSSDLSGSSTFGSVLKLLYTTLDEHHEKLLVVSARSRTRRTKINTKYSDYYHEIESVSRLIGELYGGGYIK